VVNSTFQNYQTKQKLSKKLKNVAALFLLSTSIISMKAFAKPLGDDHQSSSKDLNIQHLTSAGLPASLTETFLFTGTDSFGRAASADFSINGSNLVIVLSNISLADVLVPTDVLTGVFFNISGNPVLRKGSAVLGAASTVFYDPDGRPAGGIVGGEWAYKGALHGSGPGNDNYGISSAGLDIFGPSNVFSGSNLAGPESVGGLQYGILSAGDNTSTGNWGGIMKSGGLIKNAVTFTLAGIAAGATFSDVYFQYGTSSREPGFSGALDSASLGSSSVIARSASIPEPGKAVLMSLGLMIGAVISRRRRFRRSSAWPVNPVQASHNLK
jgi:hypothetical protein